MTRIEDDRITRGIKHPVQCNRQFNDAEIRAQMAAGLRYLTDEEFADLCRKLSALFCAQ